MKLFEHDVPRTHLKGQMVWFGLWFIVTAVALFLTPSPDGHGTHTQLGLPPCPSVSYWDRPCPGCGLTTSWTAMVHGQVSTAFASNWFGPVLYGGFTVTALMGLYGFIRRKRLLSNTREINLFLTTLLLLFMAYGIWRFATVRENSPYYLFDRFAQSRQ